MHSIIKKGGVVSAKNGSKIAVAGIEAKTADAERFQKQIKETIDRNEKAIDRLHNEQDNIKDKKIPKEIDFQKNLKKLINLGVKPSDDIKNYTKSIEDRRKLIDKIIKEEEIKRIEAEKKQKEEEEKRRQAE